VVASRRYRPALIGRPLERNPGVFMGRRSMHSLLVEGVDLMLAKHKG